MSSIALITGITGQDGSYLAEYLLNKGYEVHGIIRRASTFNTHRIDHMYVDPHEHGARLHLHYGDLSDPGILTEIMHSISPNEIYHLGAQSHVRVSFDMPEYTGDSPHLAQQEFWKQFAEVESPQNSIRHHHPSFMAQLPLPNMKLRHSCLKVLMPPRNSMHIG